MESKSNSQTNSDIGENMYYSVLKSITKLNTMHPNGSDVLRAAFCDSRDVLKLFFLNIDRIYVNSFDTE